MPTRFGADPTADELYDSLNADDPFDGADAEVVSATTLLNRAAGTNDSVSEARLSDVLYGQFERSLSAADDPRLALSSTANEIVTEADDDQLRLLETAMTDALARLVDDKFAGEPEAEMMQTVVQGILDDEFSSVSGESSDSANATAPNTMDGRSVTPPAAPLVG